uniref:Fibroblast growth factor 21 n=1 Tax=Cyclopterus lumpus TaxID=8103 RepID=A0A8C3FZ84_CYCLU
MEGYLKQIHTISDLLLTYLDYLNHIKKNNRVLELKSVQPGHVVIKGRSSSLFLCMDSGGGLSGQVQYSEAHCTFRELLLADGYTRFLSSLHRLPVSLASRHSPDRHGVPFTRFLPLRNALPEESVPEQPPNNQRHFHVDSDDLLGMGLNAMDSPQFSSPIIHIPKCVQD